MTAKRVRLLINPSARTGRGQRGLATLLAEAGVEVQVEAVESCSALHLQDLVRAAQDEDLHALALAGGDGTAALALNALAGPNRVPLALVPTGSGNDLATDLGITSVQAAIRLLHTGQPRLIDVGRASWQGRRRRYGCVASVGLDELALRHIHGSRLPRCKALNILASLRALWTYQPRPVRITWQDGSFEGEMMFIAVTNTRGYGGGFLVSPQASLHDGQLDVCIVRRTGRLRLLAHFPRILQGTHDVLPEVILARSPWVRIEGLGGEMPAALDGELPDAVTPLELCCEAQAVRVLCPEGTDRLAPVRRTGRGSASAPAPPGSTNRG